MATTSPLSSRPRSAGEGRPADRSETRLPADFDRIAVGSVATLSKTIREEDVAAFASLTGDVNPLHMDESFAATTPFRRRVAHGMLTASYVSTLVGMSLPGPGALWVQQTFRWSTPVFIGDRLEISIRVKQKSAATRAITVEVEAMNQHNKTVLNGEGTVVLVDRQEKSGEPPITERVALVTGGAGAIGGAISAALARAGAAVAVQYRSNAAAADGLCRAIAAEGGRATAFQADITDAAAIRDGLDRAAELYGKPIDLLINNAGSPPTARPFADCSWGDVQALLDAHVQGAFHCCKAALPGMIAQKSGRIVNIGSTLTWSASSLNDPAFVMAKSALKALTRSLAAELGPQGIRVNMVSPGLTETESTARIPERQRKLQAMTTPLRRLCEPDDIARTVVWLCSEAGSFVSGADIPVCGGSVM